MIFFEDYFKKLGKKLSGSNIGLLENTTQIILETKRKNKKVILAGNGGSAAIASHISVDLTKNAGVRAVTFNEADLITCFANDYGYEKWTEKAIEFYADKKDLLILISSSGKSKSMLNAARRAKKLGLNVITLSGFNKDNPLRKLGDINLWLSSQVYNEVEAIHNIWLSAIVDRIALERTRR